MTNMYPEYEGKTINFVGGECPHRCIYCYVRWFRYPSLVSRYSGKPYLIDSAFKRSLGKNGRWFVNSCSDINTIPMEWRIRIMKRLNEFPTNEYLLQSKDPAEFIGLEEYLPPKVIIGTTIESNFPYPITKAPEPFKRFVGMQGIPLPIMVSIEPIMEFDSEIMVQWMRTLNPKYISVGANSSKTVRLPEPSPEKVRALITELRKFTEVRVKPNLERIVEL